MLIAYPRIGIAQETKIRPLHPSLHSVNIAVKLACPIRFAAAAVFLAGVLTENPSCPGFKGEERRHSSCKSGATGLEYAESWNAAAMDHLEMRASVRQYASYGRNREQPSPLPSSARGGPKGGISSGAFQASRSFAGTIRFESMRPSSTKGDPEWNPTLPQQICLKRRGLA
jgi:hypothetical protein